MLKHAFLSVLAVSLLAMLLGVYFSSDIDKSQALGFPWQITQHEDGATSVFKIKLGTTTLGQAEQLFQEVAELSLFKPKDKDAVIEAFFDKVLIGGLSSKIIISFSLEKSKLLSIYDRGVRISTLGSGTRKVTLSSNDQKEMRNEMITAITYLPSINLSDDLVEKRFGEPGNKIEDKKSGAMHWLYPKKGVDVVLHESEKEVITYVSPSEFFKITEPLNIEL
jgi:hypothetical protein